MKNLAIEDENSASLGNLFRYASGQDFLFISIGSLAAVAMGILQPFIFFALASVYGEMSPSTTSEEYLDTASEICLYMVLGGILLSVFCSVAMISWIWVGSRQGFKYRSECFKRVLKQDIELLEDERIGEIAPLLANDSLKIERATGDKMINFIYPFSVIITGFTLCFYSSVKLTLLCLLFGTMILIGLFLMKKGMELKKNPSDSPYVKAAVIAEEALMEIKTVSALNSQKYHVHKYEKCLEDTEKYTIKIGLFSGLGIGIAITSHLFEVATLYYIGARGINDGDENWIRGNSVKLTEIQVILYTSLLICNNIASLIPSLKILREGKLAAYRLSRIINSPNSVTFGNFKHKIQGEIEFKDLSFSYPSRTNHPILKQVSFSVRPSTQLGVVGTTGSGKSTLTSLLLGFYCPTSGDILIDGVPIHQYSKQFLRDNIGLVNQEPFLFDTSILENIRYGYLSASFKDIKDAAFKAGALEFIEDLPEEFDTVVGTKGSQLSGGQKQRIVIARAILRNPRLLILDEATSALDRSTEQAVVSMIDEFLPDTTKICIAQNLLTLKNSDNIIVLDEGSIIEQGNHHELIKLRGKYFKLFQILETHENSTEEESERSKVEKEVIETESNQEELLFKGNTDNLKRVFRLSSDKWIWIVLAILGSIIVGTVFPITGSFWGLQLNLMVSETGESLEEQSLSYARTMYLIYVLFFIGFVLQSYGYPKTSSSVTSKLRKESLKAVLTFDTHYYAQNGYSSLSNRLATDCETINDIGATFIGILGAFIVAMFVSIGIVAYFSWEMAIMFLFILPLTTSAMGYGILGSIQGVVSFTYTKCNIIASDSLLNIRTLKAFNLEKHFYRSFEQSASDERKNVNKKALCSGIAYGISLAAMYWYYALMVWVGAKLYHEGLITFKEMAVSNSTGLTAANVFFMLLVFMGDIGGGFAAAKRIFSMLEYKPKIDVRAKSGECNPVHGRIQFENVSFSYPGRDSLAIRDVSFLVESSSKCAIIGRTGSGKSTIAQLLIRLYDPSCGNITLDYVPLDQINLKYLRENIGIVMQEPVLFLGTIEENITLGKSFDNKELSEALHIARVSEFLSEDSPDMYAINSRDLCENFNKNDESFAKKDYISGLKRDVGFKGSSLSGGQKQRVAIARTVIRKPKILVFDEATSALDPETESIVLGNLENALEGTTWIIIAHRMKTISEADSILVLESGSVVEFGPREELLENRGYFYKINQDIISLE